MLMSMHTTRPVMQRESSAPGVLWPRGTPASQPVPPLGLGELGALGFEVGAEVDGFGLGVVLFDVDGVEGADEVDDRALLLGLAGVLLVTADVGVGVGVGVLGALDEELDVAELVDASGEDEDDDAVEVAVPTPAAACSTESVFLAESEPELAPQPARPIATTPATAASTPPLPAPEVLMPLTTPEPVSALRRNGHENRLVTEDIVRHPTDRDPARSPTPSPSTLPPGDPCGPPIRTGLPVGNNWPPTTGITVK
ncbi:hypothetical protein GCM10009839_25600 [Catenulispora yoronensis]|uniref:Uncharacterized protein n=1 Tax=Catenulispora yoronensis TaxID=450799 RepID=A0ABP5FGH5_9ACTN